ncbi:sigma factor [Microbispora sp. ATCC PTA-5024]|uniref:sigma factor n=1 Tax=Microbispora sp. ATCC PTA-5024 TaxID=316330 RepID=UPI0003DC30B1|nr:sigma factor [Microbispora sp. ATCC PTA-5024]ETK34125.1 hypothetical protein MPTA5024_21200 [Microbispora sp. ATCC PTA-5024]
MAADPVRDAEFTEYVTARALWLRKVAYLLCGDWHGADDLVQAAVTKLYANWHRAGRARNVDGYARTTLVNTFLAERRSPWARQVVLWGAHDGSPVPEEDLEGILDLRAALAALPPRQRATVVLRYFCANGLPITIDVSPRKTLPRPRQAECTAAAGLDACVSAGGRTPAALASIGGLRGMLDRITLLGTDERDWTTDVIRYR